MYGFSDATGTVLTSPWLTLMGPRAQDAWTVAGVVAPLDAP
jgi:hypothetical protein